MADATVQVKCPAVGISDTESRSRWSPPLVVKAVREARKGRKFFFSFFF